MLRGADVAEAAFDRLAVAIGLDDDRIVRLRREA
jgi:hypothetical protein